MTGTEGPTSYGTGGSRWDTPTGGSYCSLEWRMCCMRYFGELTEHLCLQLLCYVFQVLARTVGRRQHDPYTLIEFMFWDSGICFCYDNIGYIMFWHYLMNKNMFWKWKIVLKIHVVTSWYQSLGLRDSGAPSGVTELKPRIWGKFLKNKGINFYKW